MSDISLVTWIFIFTSITMIHEMGHLLCARWLKAGILQIGVGCGPTLLCLKEKIEVKIKLFPLGGYIDLAHNDYEKLNLRHKLLLLSSGASVNVIVGIVTLIFLLIIYQKPSSWDSLNHLLLALINSFTITFFLIVDAIFNTNTLTAQQISSIKLACNFLNSHPIFWPLAIFTFFNLLCGFFNMLPLPRLDGGRIMSSYFQN